MADTRKCKLQKTAKVFLVATFAQSYYYTYKRYNLSNNDLTFNEIIIINQLWCIGIRCDNFNFFILDSCNIHFIKNARGENMRENILQI